MRVELFRERGRPECSAGNTQIYEGTNQIQRVVVARQFLK